MAITHLRLAPQDVDMVAVAHIFRDALDGVATPAEAEAKLNDACWTTRLSNGYFHGEAGYHRIRATVLA